jgi:hypothetical protein
MVGDDGQCLLRFQFDRADTDAEDEGDDEEDD